MPLAWKDSVGRTCREGRPAVFLWGAGTGASEPVQPLQALPWCKMKVGIKREGRELRSPILAKQDRVNTELAQRRNTARAPRDKSEDPVAA